ncbi:hypothetical protein SAMN05518871_102128 [Psychrobacillus sp. OK028]|uniref:hypothetical protein n=1 Tax=Psychrobacillus sp. OK028 TaxID=1884359 RepID=UPI000889C20C|nr:hypothetical protein [Psychrobacillus sp. OK028]SDM74013.1 hypothetical protein SAMN05518871_102128 [Psychrobacillus sp. OK028]
MLNEFLKENKKILNICILIIIFIVVLVPIIINLLMMFSTPLTVGDESIWISSLSTYLGALIGGIISGTITLIGVIYTIKSTFQSLDKDKEIEYQKMRLSSLYQPCHALTTKFAFHKGAHDFTDLAEEQKLEYLYLLQENQIYATPSLRTLILELGWSYKSWLTTRGEIDIADMNEKYKKTDDLIFEEMNAILKELTKEEKFYNLE